jgi:hypothetical protein
MTVTVQKLAEQVKSLPESEREEFLAWLADFELDHMDAWDRQIERDSAPGGALDRLLSRVHDDISATG